MQEPHVLVYTANRTALSRMASLGILLIIVIAAIAGYAYYASTASTSKTTTTTTSTGSTTATNLSTAVASSGSQTTLNVAVPLDIATGLDPQTNFDYGGANGMVIVYETLVRYAPGTNTIIPWLATKWSVSSNLTQVTFLLRSGVTFHDGTPFNATAVKFTFDRLLALNEGPASLYDGILDHVAVVNNSAVEFFLKVPYSPFISLLASPQGAGIVSPSIMAHAVNMTSSNPMGDWGSGWLTAVHEDGTGPYMLQSWTQGEQAVFVQYSGYWGGWAGQHVKQVILNVVSESATARLELQGGTVQIDYNIAPSDVASLNSTPGIVVHSYNSFNLMAMTFNNALWPTNVTLVRQALSYAYDYQQGIQSALSGLGVIPHGGFPLGTPYQNASAFQYTYDPAKAVQLLEQAGFSNSSGTWKSSNGTPFPTLNCGWQAGIQTLETACSVLQGNLAQIGITLTVDEFQRAQFFDAIAANSTTPYVVPLIVAPVVADPSDQYALYWECGEFFNTAHYCSQAAQNLSSEALATSDNATRAMLYGELQNVIINDAPAIFAWQQPYLIGFSTTVQGFKFTPSYEYYNWDNLWNITIS
jgi:peptide/nickel transport system substrate-binding protein